jgi:SAM-dependent methyltransferase
MIFNIPTIDALSEDALFDHIRSWLTQDTSISTELGALDQAFNFALPRTLFLKSLPSGAQVMDVGAGDGSLVNYKSWPMFGRPDLKLHALSLDKGEHFDSYDSYEIKNFETEDDVFPGLTFDAMVCCHFIEHMHDPQCTIEFFARRIRKGGRLYLEWPHPITKTFPPNRKLIELGFPLSTLNFFDDGTHIEAWEGNVILSMLRDCGFAIETAGRVYLPWIGEQMKNHGLANNDVVRTTIGTWAALGWPQYVIASRR